MDISIYGMKKKKSKKKPKSLDEIVSDIVRESFNEILPNDLKIQKKDFDEYIKVVNTPLSELLEDPSDGS